MSLGALKLRLSDWVNSRDPALASRTSAPTGKCSALWPQSLPGRKTPRAGRHLDQLGHLDSQGGRGDEQLSGK
jgi:hypothetical protein